MDKVTTAITPTAPFDFTLTAGYHTYFQGRYGTDSLEDGVYRRLLDLGNKLVLASVQSVGNTVEPRLTVEIQGESLESHEVIAATEQVKWILGTDEDLAPFYHLSRQDPDMSAIVDRFCGLHLPHTASVFEALVLAITGQQIATNVARIIRTLMIETHGPRQAFDGEIFLCLSPSRDPSGTIGGSAAGIETQPAKSGVRAGNSPGGARSFLRRTGISAQDV